MKPLHEEMREWRVKKGVSLEDISRITKISIHILEKLEEGDFSLVPEIYICAFLKEYAEVVGMDTYGVIEKFAAKKPIFRNISLSEKEKI